MNSLRSISDLLRLDRQPIAVGAVCLALRSRSCQSFLQRGRPLLCGFSDAGTHDANHALRQPASEKRQGTKSRWGNVGGAATMGISPRAQASVWWNVAAR